MNFVNRIPSIFTLSAGEKFEEFALEVFHFQYLNCSIYHNYVNALKIAPTDVNSFEKIPFLPIRFFKTHRVISGLFDSQTVFTSSGTTGELTSRHEVKEMDLYRQSFEAGFELQYGAVNRYCILALLPSYLERQGSSLIYMIDQMISESRHNGSGFFLYNHHELAEKLKSNGEKGIPTILWGVTFALLDFAAEFPLKLENTTVMETGGMKGRREELTRMEVHEMLQSAFGVDQIHSEYGMTELLSQAYSKGNGIFEAPPWMRILCRDTADPLSWKKEGRGGINIIDLANIYSCSFIATDDLGTVYQDGKFEISGRFDQADVRGCNLLV